MGQILPGVHSPENQWDLRFCESARHSGSVAQAKTWQLAVTTGEQQPLAPASLGSTNTQLTPRCPICSSLVRVGPVPQITTSPAEMPPSAHTFITLSLLGPLALYNLRADFDNVVQFQIQFYLFTNLPIFHNIQINFFYWLFFPLFPGSVFVDWDSPSHTVCVVPHLSRDFMRY